MHSVNSGAHPTCLGWIPRPDVLKPLHVTFRRVVAALEDLVRALEFVHVNSPRRTWRHRKVCCEIAAASRRARRRGSAAARSGVALIAPGWERGVSKKLPCARRAPPGRERDRAPACDWPLRSRRGGCGYCHDERAPARRARAHPETGQRIVPKNVAPGLRRGIGEAPPARFTRFRARPAPPASPA